MVQVPNPGGPGQWPTVVNEALAELQQKVEDLQGAKASMQAEIASLTERVFNLEQEEPEEPEVPEPTVTTTTGQGVITVAFPSLSGRTVDVSRDGVDTAGGGPWTTANAVSPTTFDKLVPSTEYTITVSYKPDGPIVIKKVTTPAADTTPTPPTGNRKWNSGVCAVSPPNITGARGYGTMRGEPIKSYRFWLDNEANQRLAGYYLGDKIGQNGSDIWLDYAIGGPVGRKGSGWSYANGGGWDGVWRTQMQGINSNWGNLRGLQLSMAHELSGNWYDWSVMGEESAFKSAWRNHYYPIVKQELKDKGRNVKVAICYALGQNQVASIYPGDDVVDVIAFDTYCQWMPTGSGHILNSSDWNTFMNAGTTTSPKGPESMRKFALDHGKPISVPEWGLADTRTGAKDDNPYYIEAMHNWFAQHAPVDPDNPQAGEVMLECLYTDPYYDLDVYHNQSKNPNSVAKIKQLVWGTA